jgi:hypothetical protein
MKRRDQVQAAKLDEADFLSAEVDNLIASAESRIERQRDYVRKVSSDFEGSMKAITELDTLTSALDKLKEYRLRITEERERR